MPFVLLDPSSQTRGRRRQKRWRALGRGTQRTLTRHKGRSSRDPSTPRWPSPRPKSGQVRKAEGQSSAKIRSTFNRNNCSGTELANKGFSFLYFVCLVYLFPRSPKSGPSRREGAGGIQPGLNLSAFSRLFYWLEMHPTDKPQAQPTDRCPHRQIWDMQPTTVSVHGPPHCPTPPSSVSAPVGWARHFLPRSPPNQSIVICRRVAENPPVLKKAARSRPRSG
mmetsp:Transcript_133496/g.231535  ORF Transcript_133496/g.231535 Transcript_133496/m.231535 type:complete len:222 (-) Transcript_133496:323-988(-)